MTICIQCALEEFVRSGDAKKMKEASCFDEEPEEHRRRVHPDLAATQKRRRELEVMAAQKMGGAMIFPNPKDNN